MYDSLNKTTKIDLPSKQFESLEIRKFIDIISKSAITTTSILQWQNSG